MGKQTASRLPLLVLVAVCLVSFGVRAAWLGLPCHRACGTRTGHVLIFDERYYVNAARVIAGIRPPAQPGAAYRHAPLGSDPNAEHPQLAKLIMAGSIELLGDGPWGWRLGSLVFGTLAILGMFCLVRWGGGGEWQGVGAAALMASDNLFLVEGRIGTLEIYVVALMVWSVALYLRGNSLLSGAVAGIGACMKLFALDVVPILVLLELARWWEARRAFAGGGVMRGLVARTRGAPGRLAAAVVAGAASFIGLLAILDEVAPPYDNTARRFVSGGPFGHVGHMVSYGAHQTGLSAAGGIGSNPWEWLVDYKPISYFTLDPAHPRQLAGDHPAVHFVGLISPPTLLAGLAGTALALWAVVRARGARRSAALSPDGAEGGQDPLAGPAGGPPVDGAAGALALPRLSAAWFVGTFGPFLIASLAFNRTSYLYYMTIVMPGMYVAAVWLAARVWHLRWLFWSWVGLVAASAILLYPFTPLP